LTHGKGGGKPTFPTLRLFKAARLFQVESLSGDDPVVESDQLEVRKVGLPPLFFVRFETLSVQRRQAFYFRR
jgi:hypothetical protein